jgi:hypothetical protein
MPGGGKEKLTDAIWSWNLSFPADMEELRFYELLPD